MTHIAIKLQKIFAHFAIFDAASGGNMLAHGQFTVSKSVTTDDTPVLIAGDVNVSLD